MLQMQRFYMRKRGKKYSTFQLQAVIETWKGVFTYFLEGWTEKMEGYPWFSVSRAEDLPSGLIALPPSNMFFPVHSWYNKLLRGGAR